MQTEAVELQMELAIWRKRLVTGLLYASLPVGLLALIGALNNVLRESNFSRAAIYIAAYLVVLTIALVRHLPYLLRAVVFLLIAYGLGLLGLLDSGLSGDGRVFLLAFPIIATILLGQTAGVVSLGLSMVTLAIVGWMMSTGDLSITVESMANSTDPNSWISGSAVVLLTATIMLVPLSHLLQGQMFAVQLARKNQALREAQIALETTNKQLRHELTERKRAEEALKESEKKYRLVVENAHECILVAQDGMLKFFNTKTLEFFGYTPEELATKPFAEFIHPDDKEMVLERHMRRLKGEEPPAAYNFRIIHKFGDLKWVEINVIVISWEGRPATLNFLNDITERKGAEEQIKASLKEKEVLLKEIHHRVKNNLQIISSLLNLQSNFVEDKQTIEVFQDSQNRIRSMALVHEKLYRSENLARIDFAEYIRDLAAYLFHSHRANTQGITLKIQIDEVFLGIDTAISCGLILNELISNALKHAFPNGRAGETRLECRASNDGQLTLIVADNGVGFPEALDFRETTSLGLQLVTALVDQLDGTIDMHRNTGTEFKITFATVLERS